MGIRDIGASITQILKDQDVQKTAKEDLTGLFVAAISGDPVSTAVAGKKVYDDARDLPALIFWDKVNRYFRGTFHSFEDQIKLASRFDKDSKNYERFVKKVILMIDQVEDDEKIDFYANLTTAFYLELVDADVFFKLAKFLLLLTYDELMFIRGCSEDFRSELTVMISSLYQFGLFDQVQIEGNETRYVLSSFALSLKRNCLNFEEGVRGKERLGNYDELKPLMINRPATDAEVDQMIGVTYNAEDKSLKIGRQK